MKELMALHLRKHKTQTDGQVRSRWRCQSARGWVCKRMTERRNAPQAQQRMKLIQSIILPKRRKAKDVQCVSDFSVTYLCRIVYCITVMKHRHKLNISCRNEAF